MEEAVELNVKMWVEGLSREESEVDSKLRERVRIMQRAAFVKQLHAKRTRLRPARPSGLTHRPSTGSGISRLRHSFWLVTRMCRTFCILQRN